MPLEWWTTLAVALFFSALSPGSATLFALRTGLRGNLLYAAPAIVGLELGSLSILATIFALLALSIEVSPHILDSMALCGGTYLIFLGGKDLWQAFSSGSINLKNTASLGHISHSAHDSWKKYIVMGTLINLINPQAYLFAMAFTSQWLQASMPWSFSQQALAISLLYLIIDSTVLLGYARFSGLVSAFLDQPWAFRLIQGFLGAIFCGLGVTMGIMRFL